MKSPDTDLLEQIEVFKDKTGYILQIQDGKLCYNESMFDILSNDLPDDLTVNGSLQCKEESTKLPRGLKVKMALNIAHTKIKTIPRDCEFSHLNISYTKITKLRDNLVLNELFVTSSSLTKLPKNLKVKGSLCISYTAITEIPEDCEFGGLFMSNTKIKKLRDNLTLDNLYVRGSELTELPKNLIVYISLDIRDTSITSISKDCLAKNIYCNFKLKDERYEHFLDNHYILKPKLIHIKHSSGCEFINLCNLYKVIEDLGNKYYINSPYGGAGYLVTDGTSKWIYSKTEKIADLDLLFLYNNKNSLDYQNLSLDDELSYNDAIICYRLITNACTSGIQYFLDTHLPKPHKEKYTIREIIELTKEEFGGYVFEMFFADNIKNN